MKNVFSKVLAAILALGFIGCDNNTDDNPAEPMLIVKFQFDPNQPRLNNIGLPTAVATGNAAQSPSFNSISAHYLEFAPTANTQLGEGKVVYRAAETTIGGTNAIDFRAAKIVAEGEQFLTIPLSQLASGNYNWVRVSLSYQNYNINVRSSGADYEGTLASYVGFNNYIGSYSIGNNTFNVNGNRLQGYWAFALTNFPYAIEGQAPAGATTVPNPLASTSPIPAGSCVVTGKFLDELVITGNETQNVTVTLALSINNSFEWSEVITDGKYEPAAGENVIDMGLRGLVPSWQAGQ